MFLGFPERGRVVGCVSIDGFISCSGVKSAASYVYVEEGSRGKYDRRVTPKTGKIAGGRACLVHAADQADYLVTVTFKSSDIPWHRRPPGEGLPG